MRRIGARWRDPARIGASWRGVAEICADVGAHILFCSIRSALARIAVALATVPMPCSARPGLAPLEPGRHRPTHPAKCP